MLEHAQPAPRGERTRALPVGLVALEVVDRRDSLGVERRGRVIQQRIVERGRGAFLERREHAHGVLADEAVRLAAGAALEASGRRVRSVLRDAGRAQRRAVDPQRVEVVTVEQHRPAGRERIECRRQGRGAPAGVVPPAAYHWQRLALRLGGSRRQLVRRKRGAHALDRLLARAASVQVELLSRPRPRHQVDVRVHEPGRDRAPVRVDHLLHTAFVAQLRPRADGDDAAVVHEHGVAFERTPRPRPAVHDQQRRAHAGSAATGFTSVPTPSTVTATMSPGSMGAIPAGVPVAITSPGSSVTNRLR